MESNTYPATGNGHDFLAIYGVGNVNFGKLVSFVPTTTPSQMAHHINFAMGRHRLLFTNDFMAAESYVFDVDDPHKPAISATFTNAGPYTHPHTFVQLSNGHILATYQVKDNVDTTGGLVELDINGRMIRASDASAPNVDPNIRPYSLQVIESLDRVVTTTAVMPPLETKEAAHEVQVWRLHDLKLLKTIDLPKPPTFKGIANQDPDEAALLADGKTLLVKTSRCGLFELTGVEGSDPEAQFVYDFGGRSCSGVPVVVGNYWIEASMSNHDIVALDVHDPAHPVEASRLYLGPNAIPHWMSGDASTGDLVITGFGSLLHRISLAHVDTRTGALTLDSRAIDMLRQRWPDGWNGAAVPHGTMFY